MNNFILLNNKVPIRLIEQPFCIKCMNPVGDKIELCESCLNFPHPKISDWYFNRIISLGIYKTYQNENYNNIPLNILSRMILILKGKVKKNKERVGKFLADGLIQMINKYPFLLGDLTYLIIPPKDDISEENQCLHFLKPFMKRLEKIGNNYENLSNKIKRIKKIGKNRNKTYEERFEDIIEVHQLEEMDLQGNKVLILDDVITSKATIWDISRELQKNNANEINILSIGRTFLTNNIMEEDIPPDLDFYMLLTYFSNLDNILEPKKIEKIKIKKFKINEDKFECLTEKYSIEIDFKKMSIKHNCYDFYQTRCKNKLFCKHITKFFLEIQKEKGEEFAREKLYLIYKNLIYWDFFYIDN